MASNDGRWVGWVALAGVMFLFAVQWSQAQEVRTSLKPEDIVAQFDMDPDGDLLVVPVTVGRQTVPFILDTGTTLNSYDVLLQNHLGPLQEVVDVRTASGREALKLYDPPRAYLGRLNLRTPQGVMCVNLAGARQATGHNFYGIVGMTFLLDRTLHLNFDEGKLSFLRSDAPRLGIPIPLAMVREMPRVQVEFEGLGLRSLLVDTGSVGIGSGNLRTGDFDSLAKRGDLVVLGNGFSSDLSKQRMTARYGAVKQIKVGPERHDNLIFSDHVNSDILGMGFWKRYNVTLDFPNRVVYLQKNQFDPALDDASRDLSGLHLKGRSGCIVVHGVNQGSPASNAGIQPGDLLAKLDGKDAAELRVRTIRRHLCMEGKEVSLALRRGDQDLQVVLKLPERKIVGARITGP